MNYFLNIDNILHYIILLLVPVALYFICVIEIIVEFMLNMLILCLLLLLCIGMKKNLTKWFRDFRHMHFDHLP